METYDRICDQNWRKKRNAERFENLPKIARRSRRIKITENCESAEQYDHAESQ